MRLVPGCITSCFPMKVALLRHRVAMTRVRTTAGQLGPKYSALLKTGASCSHAAPSSMIFSSALHPESDGWGVCPDEEIKHLLE